jgi:predicted house-cleaning noncanonical NTP pyrophosphatase (MazG superfamily)
LTPLEQAIQQKREKTMIDPEAMKLMGRGIPTPGQPEMKFDLVIDQDGKKIALQHNTTARFSQDALNQLAEFINARDQIFLPWQMINVLILQNAWHIKKNKQIRDFTDEEMLEHLQDEVAELAKAPKDINEAADILVILYHLAIRNGWTLKDLSDAAQKKIVQRFSFRSPAERAGEEELGELFDDGNNRK